MMNIYSIRDAKADSYGLPFYAQNLQVALRNVRASLIGKDTQLSLFPDDFSVYCVGTWDEVSGIISGGQASFVCSIGSLLEVENAS